MMQPVPPPDKDAKLRVHEHPDPQKHDLLGEIVVAVGEGGVPECLEERIHFLPSREEAAAIAAGAPVIMHVEGKALDPDTPTGPEHLPFVQPTHLTTGKPPTLPRPLLHPSVVNMALGALFSLLSEPLPESKGSGYVVQHTEPDGSSTMRMLDATDFIATWERCLSAAEQAAVQLPGDGASIEDLALPGTVRDDL